MSGDDVMEVINQAAPTSCIQVPMFENKPASQIDLKRGSAKGDHIDAGSVFWTAIGSSSLTAV
jgi:hypothetical protein